MEQAKQGLRDWDAEITARIERLRAQGSRAGLELTYRESLDLAGAWDVAHQFAKAGLRGCREAACHLIQHAYVEGL